jgi:hypothetical protein
MSKEKTQHTTTAWYLVANTPGVDIRHKFDGQELILVENVNYQIANKIIRAVNSHDELVGLLIHMKEYLEGEAEQPKTDAIKKAIAQAEGK